MEDYEKQRKQWKTERRIGIGILVAMFAVTVFIALKDSSSEEHAEPEAKREAIDNEMLKMDSPKSLSLPISYSEYYQEGYVNGFEAGQEDTNDGDYQAGFDDSNPYSGQHALDYSNGYNAGYEDGYEETIDFGNEDDEPL